MSVQISDRMTSDRIRSDRTTRHDVWVDEEDGREAAFKPLTRDQARALVALDPPLSPWRVVIAQAVVGGLVALVVWLVTRRTDAAASAFYGAATAVLPGALMARGMTSQLSSLSPGISTVSVLLWEAVKIAVSIAMLMLAPRLVPHLSWPALLIALAVCIKVYWVALSWRGRKNG